MSEPPRKRQRMTPLQKEKILHYFHLNKEFSQNDSIQNDQWRRYAADLNELGLSKSVKQWKTVLVPKSCVYGKLQRLSNFEDLDSATSKPSDPGGLPVEDSIAQEPNSKKQQIIIKDIVGNVVDQNWNESTNSNNMNLTTISPESQAAVVYPSTIGPGVALIICNDLNNLEDIHKNTNNSLGKFNVDIQMVAQELQQRQAAELNSSTTDFPAEVNNEPLHEKMDE